MMDFDRSAVAWTTSKEPVAYPLALAAMEERARQIRAGDAPELIWLLEHPALYTAGTSAQIADLKDPDRFPIYTAGRGGQYTYHGPGQRIAYVMLDVQRRFGSDVRAFVCALEHWVIDSLAEFGIRGEIRPGRVGVWVVLPNEGGVEKKIAAIGIRIRRGVSFHGISLNVAPDLTHYDGIVPCGIAEHGVTSLHDLGHPASMKDVDMSLRRTFERTFGVTADSHEPVETPLAAHQNGPKRD
ncbi:lipoyl(octanoyl) transferase LipB [Hyphomicrobium sp. DMF-1]|jgi:lipoyl(octanoyl) transferase|uniref:lipoyl(octanoyl) transferase LipB n=1 Tax=Hyphomicrobium sp. DMF-1 TaxID=3019544 RepID=UPI0022EBC516|nr:lipoyl(octanoyl) transferase LipB [Hyphomicrobium sp. DMF-1]WBT39936.1 lipoyl(octanoyl) transferase LipB [Hyphomicrobium sp. DMF-1]